MTTIFNWVYNAFFGRAAQAEETIIHTWAVGGKEVQLLCRENLLDCLVIDHTTRERWRVDPPPDPRPLHERIDRLLQTEPILGNDYSVTFARRTEHPRWPRQQFADGRTIALAQLGKDLIWRQFSKKGSNHILATEDAPNLGTYLHELPEQAKEHYYENLRKQKDLAVQIGKDQSISEEQIQSEVKARCLQGIPLANRLAYFQDFEIEGYENPSKLTAVALKKISAVSRIDNETPIDRSNWAVTVLCCGRDWHGHAVIAYEGVKKGKPFLNYAHLKGRYSFFSSTTSGEVELIEEGQENWRQLKDQGKTETWSAKRYKVQAMEKRIRWEVAQQEKGKTPVHFNVLGSDSFLKSPVANEGINWEYVVNERFLPEGEFVVPNLTHPHNCITWAAEKLKLIGVNLPLGKYSSVITLPKEYVNSKPSRRAPVRQVANEPAPSVAVEPERPPTSEEIRRMQVERERELESLKQQFEEVDQQLQNFAVDERRLNLGREAKCKQRERNTFVPLTKEEIESIGYADRVGLQKLRLTSSKHLLQLRIHQKKQSVDGLYMIAQMQEAEEKGNLQKATQIRRIYLAYAAFIECSSWAGMILEKFEEMNARQLNSRH